MASTSAASVDAGGASTATGDIPFVVGSNLYQEPPFSTNTVQLGATSQETVVNITPGGFLRGIMMQVSSTGGVLGSGTLQADMPFSILQSVTLEDISGGPVIYPMNGFAHYLCQKYLRPWDGDPAKRAGFSAGINPAFTLQFSPEVKDTLAVLANTDARAQYRFRYTLSPGNVTSGPTGVMSGASGSTQPTVTVLLSINSWAQPDLQDLLGNSIEQIPDGLVASRFLMHEEPVITAGNNVIRETLTGNEYRGIIWLFRNGNTFQTRFDLSDANAGPIMLRQDSRQIWRKNPSQIVESMNRFYGGLGNGTWTRETGVYVIPRFAGPAAAGEKDSQGEYWQQTVEQTLLIAEFLGADIASSPGTLEIVYDALAIAGAVPPELEGI